MAKKYLDDTGMSYFWGKLKAYFQEKLVSGTNIKTINNETLLGSGNVSVPTNREYLGSGSISKSLTNSYAIVPCTNVNFVRGSGLSTTTSGGIKCNKSGTVVARAYVSFSGATSGDLLSALITRRRSGTDSDGYTCFSLTSSGGYGTVCVFDSIVIAQADDEIYVRARNNSASRGTITNARLYAEYIE